jgi:threonine dehydratase
MRVPAFDQNETIMGQGTVGLELEQQAPDIDTVLVAVGGGGLVSGVAAWYAGRIKVIGVEPFASPTLTRALEAGHPVDAEAGGLAADSLAPRRVGERVLPIAQKYAPRTVLVTDEAIAEAQKTLWRALRIVAEPGGAAAFSAILSGAYRPEAGERVAVVISGGNTAAVNFDTR